MSKQKKSMAIIGTVGVPSKYGGFETLAHHLVKQLNQKLNLTVYNSTHHYSAKERVSTWEGANIVYLPLKPNGVHSIFYDSLSMLHAIFFVDILLILGVSGCIFLPLIKKLSTKRIIVNVDGMEWKRRKWGWLIKVFLNYSEKLAIKYADEIICDNAVIQEYVRRVYKRESTLIAYGADHTQKKYITPKLIAAYPFLQKEYAFKVCRIEPENNIDMVLDAFALIKNIPLIIVGNWSHSKYGIDLKEKYATYENIVLLDPIYDLEILDAMRSNCTMYIHGHSAGGTNPSLVEAMHLGLPIFSFNVGYNRATTHNAAIFFASAQELADKILTTDAAELKTVGKTLEKIAQDNYSWKRIAQLYHSAAYNTIEEPITVKKSQPTLAVQ